MALANFGELHLLTRHQVQELDSQGISYKQEDKEDERSKVHQRKMLTWQATCWHSLTFVLKVSFWWYSSFADLHFF